MDKRTTWLARWFLLFNDIAVLTKPRERLDWTKLALSVVSVKVEDQYRGKQLASKLIRTYL